MSLRIKLKQIEKDYRYRTTLKVFHNDKVVLEEEDAMVAQTKIRKLCPYGSCTCS